MALTKEQAETAITLSALVTTGLFAYRKVTEPEAPESVSTHPGVAETYRSLVGAAPPVSWGQFLKAAGAAYIAMAIIGAISPPLGGGFAILTGTTAFLGNIIAVRKDLASTGYQEALAAGEAARIASGEVKHAPTSGAPVRAHPMALTNSGKLNSLVKKG
jgi:hypothetical protein